MVSLKQKYDKEVVPSMQKQFKYANILAVPRISKVVVAMGVGRITDKNEIADIIKILTMITGQKPSPRLAKKAIASFKTRLGQTLGYKVTLRRNRMQDFLDRFIGATLPRTRDFRGILLKNIDESGNLNIGVPEHIVFPEMVGEDIKKIFGLQVTVVLNKPLSRERAVVFYKLMGFPLRKA